MTAESTASCTKPMIHNKKFNCNSTRTLQIIFFKIFLKNRSIPPFRRSSTFTNQLRSMHKNITQKKPKNLKFQKILNIIESKASKRTLKKPQKKSKESSKNSEKIEVEKDTSGSIIFSIVISRLLEWVVRICSLFVTKRRHGCSGKRLGWYSLLSPVKIISSIFFF